ncbi:hypothetical protein AALO_G00292970 [Alosa alosa]|uniref:Intersectin-1 n=1 Tax=Alosa alosa TaxID=278164 RepID=A0AAV6FLT6_9TELE|nr:hypothetical protein AALO_G00292970 [Alosa alosa]
MAQFPTSFGGGADTWVISVDERVKHDQQFHSLAPTPAGFITGDQARNFFLQSGLPPPILAQIWALADMNSDGKMDMHEFSIAMKLIKLKLQGHPLPPSLPPSMKQPSLMTQPPPFAAMPPVPPMPTLPPGMPLAVPPGVSPMPIPPIPGMGMSPPLVSSVPPPVPPMPNGAPAMIPPITGFTNPASAALNKSSSFNRSSAKLQKGQSFETPSAPAAPPPPDWAVPQSSRLKYRQLFNSHDKMMSGHLTGPQARTILMQSSLPQAQLATIWNLSDIDQDGKLTAEEFILAMHLIDMAMSGLPLPPLLPPDFIPPTFRRVRSGSGVSVTSVHSVDLRVPEEPEEEDPKILPVTFEDKKRENFERGNLELEKRRQALLEQQRQEAERVATLERHEQERKERERQEQERRRLHQLERQLEKQRELERQLEGGRGGSWRGEKEEREAAKRELERQRQLEWERNRRQELLNQRNREQENIVLLKARKKTLEFELEALSDKKTQLEGKLLDLRSRLSGQRQEIENTNKTRELRIAEITTLQQHTIHKYTQPESQQWLARLIPDKQCLNDQLKQVQQNSLHSKLLTNLQRALQVKETARQQLKDQLDEVEQETRAKLLEIDAFNTQLKELREIHAKQQQRHKQMETLEGDAQPTIDDRKSVELPEARLSGTDEVVSPAPTPTPPPAQAWLSSVSVNEEEMTVRKDTPDKLSQLFLPPPQPQPKLLGQAPWPTGDKPPAMSSIQEKMKMVYYRALYPFDARSHDEITIQPGDIVMVDETQTGEPGWLGGELKGKTGWFPANYAEKIPESEPPPPEMGPVQSAAPPAPLPPPGAAASSSSSASSNWADFSTTWPSNSVDKPDSDGWDAWPSQAAPTTAPPPAPQPSLSVPSGGPLRQRSAFTPATLSGSSPSPVLGQGEKVEGLQARPCTRGGPRRTTT